MPTAEREAWLSGLLADWRGVVSEPVDRALCAFAEQLTLHPSRMSEADVEALRVVGLDDAGIHDATQVVSYFNYINRVADALDVDLEPEMPAPERG